MQDPRGSPVCLPDLSASPSSTSQDSEEGRASSPDPEPCPTLTHRHKARRDPRGGGRPGRCPCPDRGSFPHPTRPHKILM